MNSPSIETDREEAAQAATVEIISAFVDSGAGGNPAGVVFDADHLSEDELAALVTRNAMIGTERVAAPGASPGAAET